VLEQSGFVIDAATSHQLSPSVAYGDGRWLGDGGGSDGSAQGCSCTSSPELIAVLAGIVLVRRRRSTRQICEVTPWRKRPERLRRG
jgi:hypothetical protein